MTFKYHILEQGFSLLEVLVAMGVMALVLVTLFRMHGSTLMLAGAGRFVAMVPPAVSQILASAEMNRAVPDRMPESFEKEFRGLSWTCTMEDASFDESLDILPLQSERFKKILVTVTGSGRSQTIVTWRYFNETTDD